MINDRNCPGHNQSLFKLQQIEAQMHVDFYCFDALNRARITYDDVLVRRK